MKQILTTIVFMISVFAFSQNKTITGTITDNSGQPLPSASIVEKGTSNGVQSDFDGVFSIEVSSETAILQISYIGFTSQEISVEGKEVFSITLEEDLAALDEVVIIGYGKVKKKDLTGAVSSVDAKDAYVAPTASLDNALQGRATGVQVTSSNGTPGSSASIIIRGGNSITGGNEPLYVIDGFVGAGDISTLNPNDIESIQILKDASSTAIYGARGTNGVILVTTKKGKKGKLTVNFKASTGFQSLPQQIDVQTGREFAEFINGTDPDQMDLPFDLNNLPGEETNWQDVLTRTAQISDYQLSVSGGSDNAQYYVSAGYLNQEGIVIGSGFKRYSLRTNVDTKLSKVFKAGVNLSLSRTETDNDDIGNFRLLIREDPLKPVYDSEGNYTIGNFGVSNQTDHLLANAKLNQNDTFRDRALINTYIQAELSDKFTLKSTFGGDFIYNKNHQFIPSSNPASIRQGLLGQAAITRFNDIELLNENTINYNETFGDHTLGVLAGATFQTQNRETVVIVANEIPSDGVGVNAIELAPSENVSINSNYSEAHLVGFLGRVNYSFKDKYLLTASIRRDGSSRLGANNRYENFPSMALAWKISQEPFMDNIESINNLKIRASFGITGNQGVNPFSTLSTFTTLNTATVVDGVIVAGVVQGNLSNPDLKWETTSQFDLGMELSMFNSRFSAELDYYYKKTNDLLLYAGVPAITGYENTLQNAGSLENRGFDLTLVGKIIDNEDFGWTTTLNVSTFKNKVLELGVNSFIDTSNLAAPANDTNSRLIVGEPVGTFWGAIYEGVDPATGDAIYKDISGPDGVPDGVYDPEYDKTIIGSANPDFYGGFQTSFRYKNFDLMAFFPFSVGNENYNEEMFLASETQLNSFAAIRDNMWSYADPDNALYPRAGSNSWNVSSSLYVQDASYFRLGTLQFGYSLPTDSVKGFSKLRVYFTGTNLFLIKSKDYLGYDPDVNTSSNSTNTYSSALRGFDNIGYPQNRSLLFGLDLTF
ncbi:TonB-dependent receptor [Lacinutrix sp. C3R15]|uniref:SusC/RagA family TonB-linked outer membrane protein n=1 Tax=Flavobacteriaceae TaxID=49546 RepID=UPI001C0946B2|nr:MULTISPECIES: TonB-dependent receptor [Flavobacteriaceae]MBU2939183.1 TonB-dependent receptor [Lacinutrix sp. C3R15]MDO6622499.1 TonB-dependent receptor [Oceanihabitans sp. 1_MG-2023]